MWKGWICRDWKSWAIFSLSALQSRKLVCSGIDVPGHNEIWDGLLRCSGSSSSFLPSYCTNPVTTHVLEGLQLCFLRPQLLHLHPIMGVDCRSLQSALCLSWHKNHLWGGRGNWPGLLTSKAILLCLIQPFVLWMAPELFGWCCVFLAELDLRRTNTLLAVICPLWTDNWAALLSLQKKRD